jgi:predicted RNA-binding Zn-ribbon protein involved in translation (DUF1610 family)
MPENHSKPNAIEKNCRDSECREKLSSLTTDEMALFTKFTYCPFCSEELILVCQNCREELDNPDYHFCPWCGVKFAQEDENDE